MKKTETNSNETYRMTIGKTEIYGVSIQQLTKRSEHSSKEKKPPSNTKQKVPMNIALILSKLSR